MLTPPKRGEVWLLDFDPIIGHEQAGIRPGIVLSMDRFNRGPSSLMFVCPLTSRSRNLSFHLPVEPPEGGLTMTSYIMTDNLRSVSQERIIRRMGIVSDETMEEVEDKVRILLGL